MAKQKKKQVKKQIPKSPPPAAKVQWFQQARLVAMGLFLLSVLLYANTLGHDYTLDDAIVITDNVIVKQGVSGWGDLFSHDTFYGFFQDESKARLVSGGRYRPLTLAMFGLERTIAEGPFLHHLFNLLWYGLTVVMLYLLVLTITRQRATVHQQAIPAKASFGQQFFAAGWGLPIVAALVFAFHPLHTEVVANIKGRDEIMTLLGSLATTWLVWRAANQKSWGLAAAAGAVFFLALLAKESAITFIFIIPLVLAALRPQFKPNDLVYTLPSLLAAVIFLGIRQKVLGPAADNEILELMNNPFLKYEGGQWVAFSFGEWSATVMYGLGKYLQLLFFPIDLSHDYYPRAFEIMDWSNWRVLLSLLANTAFLGLGVYYLLGRKHRLLGVGILIYFITLGLVSNILFPVGTLLSERFLFLPSFGFALALGWVLHRCSKRIGSNILFGFLGILLLLYGYRTLTRNAVWQDNYTLFTTDVEVQEGSAKLQNAAAGAKIDAYLGLSETQQSSRKNLLQEARTHLDQALTIHPTYKQAYYLRGMANMLLDNYDVAATDFQQALVVDPAYEAASERLLMNYQLGGRYYGEQQGDLNKSRQMLQQALSLDPNSYETLRLLGVLNGVSGNQTEAIKYFQRCTEVAPDIADAWWNLGTAYYQGGQEDLAQQYFARARQLEPGIEERKRNGG